MLLNFQSNQIKLILEPQIQSVQNKIILSNLNNHLYRHLLIIFQMQVQNDIAFFPKTEAKTPLDIVYRENQSDQNLTNIQFQDHDYDLKNIQNKENISPTLKENRPIIFEDSDSIDSPEENGKKQRKININKKMEQNTEFSEQSKKLESCRIIPVKCTFLVEKNILFQQKFHLHHGKEHLLTARRKFFKFESLFYFFDSEKKLSTKDESYLGYMQSNLYRTQYSIYNKNKVNLALIMFNVSKNDPISMSIYIPKYLDETDQTPIKNRILRNYHNIIEIASKKPIYDSTTNEFYLDFMGKAGTPSLKNCILEIQDEIVAIFAKEKDKCYHYQFTKPMLDIVAFGFAIAQYQEKLGYSTN